MNLLRTKFYKIALGCLLVVPIISGTLPAVGYTQTAQMLDLPAPGTLVTVSDAFYPAVLKGLTIYTDEPFRFDFIIDTGNTDFTEEQLQPEADKLIKYFMAALTVPERKLWVNLSPYERDRIIPPVFGETEMGRDLLAQDYLLKQLTASLIHPESELGGTFWRRVYQRVHERFGSVEVPVDTFNKIWIVPQTADVFVSGTHAFVTKSRLKVMLEEDYLALRQNAGHNEHGLGDVVPKDLSPTAGLSAQIIREIIVPEIEHEVNHGKNFANLRQIFHSLILAAWYKQNLKDSLFARSYVDRGKTKGIEVSDPRINQHIYEQYVKAYEKGVYNYIREDYNEATQSTIPRKYFSGGVEANITPVLTVDASAQEFSSSIQGELITVKTFARARHSLWHQQGAFSQIMNDIAKELGLSWTNGGYPFVGEVQAQGGLVQLKNGGRLELSGDGILLIIDPRFKRDHAGRGSYQLAVYARDEDKARHELAELRFIISAAREVGILQPQDDPARLSERLQAWANETVVGDQERLRRQNRLIEIAAQAHRYGLMAEGRTTIAQNLVGPALLTRPLSDFDITIASDGAQVLNLYNYFQLLDEKGYEPLMLSMAQLLAAVIRQRPSMLVKPEQMTQQAIEDTFSRLAEFDPSKMEETIMAATDMTFEDLNLYRHLAKVIHQVINEAPEERLEQTLAQLNYVYPDEFENVLSGVPRAVLTRRLQQIGLSQRRYHNGELPTVISFGDKHGRTADLERILNRAREAAHTGDPLVIVGHGDGFDRGDNNVDVFKIFQQLKTLEKEHDNITVKLLFGNHDAWLMEARLGLVLRDEDVWFHNGGWLTLDEFRRHPGGIEELMHFMIQNFDLYYTDEWGMLHIHSGFRVGMDGKPEVTAEGLQQLQDRLEKFRSSSTWSGEGEMRKEEREALWELMNDMEKLITVSRETWDQRFRNIRVTIEPDNFELMYQIAKGSILHLPSHEQPTERELRAFFDENWRELLITTPDTYLSLGVMFEFDDSQRDTFLMGRMDRFMAQMGVLGVINGHHHHNKFYQVDQRIYGVDVDDDDAGHMEMSTQGVRFYPLNRQIEEVITSPDEMLEQWEQQRRRLLAHFAQRQLRRLLRIGKLQPPSDEDVAMMADDEEVEFTVADRNKMAQAADDLVEEMAKRNIRKIFLSGTSAFITMELLREAWVERFGNDWDMPLMIVIDAHGGSRVMMGWQQGDLLRNLQKNIPDFDPTELHTEMHQGRVAILDDHIAGAAKMKTFHRLFMTDFGVAPVIGALVAVKPIIRHIGFTARHGEFEVVAGAFDIGLVQKVSGYGQQMREVWKKNRPYVAGPARTTTTDDLIEDIKARINGSDEALLNNPGGIDLNPAGLKLNVSGDTTPLAVPVTAPVSVPEIDGYMPIIINITPTTNLPFILGKDIISMDVGLGS